MARAKYVFLNDQIVPWEKAQVHVFSPVAKYGAGVFEGIRGYWNPQHEEMYIFRLPEHLDRLTYSQSMMRLERIVSPEYLTEKTIALLQANEFRETVHIRTQVFVDGEGDVGARGPVGVAIIAVPRPMPKQLTEGVTAQVSSWIRISDLSMPARVKSNANYQNGRLAQLQAKADGYDAPILLNSRGKVSEGAAMCFFMVRNGRAITPSVTSDILESVTRSTLLDLIREQMGTEPIEREIDRSELYAAEEAFFCGTGWEVTPITGIDRLPVGTGKVGPFVQRLQKIYFDIVGGVSKDHAEWRTPVYRRRNDLAAQ